MDVKRCDRCGAVYECGESNVILIVDEVIWGPEHPKTRQRGHLLMFNGAPVEAKDICHGCAEDFKKWFERMGKRVTE